MQNSIFKDPRHYQILFLGAFLSLGLALRFIDIQADFIAVFISGALIAQLTLDFFANRISNKSVKSMRWNWKSALITSLSLCLLLRTPSLYSAFAASFFAICSKRLFQIKGEHIFNPANISIVCCVLFLGGWISPGQWGHHAWMLFVFIGLGFIVSVKAARTDVAVIFIATFIVLLLLRTWYLGDPIEIAVHQLNNGALLLFAFFMITDPRTSPRHATARIVYAMSLGLLSFTFQYYFFVPQGMMFALALICLIVPILNLCFVDESYKWPT